MIERRRDEGPTYAELDEMSEYCFFNDLRDIEEEAIAHVDRWLSYRKIALAGAAVMALAVWICWP